MPTFSPAGPAGEASPAPDPVLPAGYTLTSDAGCYTVTDPDGVTVATTGTRVDAAHAAHQHLAVVLALGETPTPPATDPDAVRAVATAAVEAAGLAGVASVEAAGELAEIACPWGALTVGSLNRLRVAVHGAGLAVFDSRRPGICRDEEPYVLVVGRVDRVAAALDRAGLTFYAARSGDDIDFCSGHGYPTGADIDRFDAELVEDGLAVVAERWHNAVRVVTVGPAGDLGGEDGDAVEGAAGTYEGAAVSLAATFTRLARAGGDVGDIVTAALRRVGVELAEDDDALDVRDGIREALAGVRTPGGLDLHPGVQDGRLMVTAMPAGEYEVTEVYELLLLPAVLGEGGPHYEIPASGAAAPAGAAVSAEHPQVARLRTATGMLAEVLADSPGVLVSVHCSPHTTNAELQVCRRGADPDGGVGVTFAGLAACARVLGVGLRAHDYTDGRGGYTVVSGHAARGGVAVKVWAMFEDPCEEGRAEARRLYGPAEPAEEIPGGAA